MDYSTQKPKTLSQKSFQRLLNSLNEIDSRNVCSLRRFYSFGCLENSIISLSKRNTVELLLALSIRCTDILEHLILLETNPMKSDLTWRSPIGQRVRICLSLMEEMDRGLNLVSQGSYGTNPDCPLVNFEQLELDLKFD